MDENTPLPATRECFIMDSVGFSGTGNWAVSAKPARERGESGESVGWSFRANLLKKGAPRDRH
jgi:hypothetical protein